VAKITRAALHTYAADQTPVDAAHDGAWSATEPRTESPRPRSELNRANRSAGTHHLNRQFRAFTVPTTEVMGYFILPSGLWGCLIWIVAMGG